jgi:heparan-alpha-glucosaminide N-acetyltransferase
MSALAAPARVTPGPIRVTPATGTRIPSVDALRGLVVFTMIFVNDLAGASDSIVPPWMKHFRGRSGMTFVDLVFPGFLFIVGMSLPLALGWRLKRGESLSRVVAHVIVRTLSLLWIGILMVNGIPDSSAMGWSGTLWTVLMYSAAILAFCSVSPRAKPVPPNRETPMRVPVTEPPVESASGSGPGPASATARNPIGAQQFWRRTTMLLRVLGLAALVWLTLVFRGREGQAIVAFSPLSLHHSWYGILGLIGWAYLISSMVFLIFRGNRTALLGCMVLLMCLYAAERTGTFANLWVAKHVGLGSALGSQAAISVAGLLLATVLTWPGSSLWMRTRFTLLFIAGTLAGALLLNGLYGINKNQATPSWCLWACAVMAALWLVLHLIGEVKPSGGILHPLAIAGQNVFLAYLLSSVLPSLLDLIGVSDWYAALATPHLAHAVARSAGVAALILGTTALLNAIGLRLKL